MKKLIIALVLLLPTICGAHGLSILLTCNIPDKKVEFYEILVNGEKYMTFMAQEDGSLHKSIQIEETGKYRFRARACAGGVCGAPSKVSIIEYITYINIINKNNFKVIRYVYKYIER